LKGKNKIASEHLEDLVERLVVINELIYEKMADLEANMERTNDLLNDIAEDVFLLKDANT